MQTHLAFISGAGGGLGKELAYQLAQRKTPLFITSKDPHKLRLAEEELKTMTSVIAFAADLSKQEELNALLEKIRLYRPDLIINNAGIGLYGEILSFPLQEQMQILQININALVQISIESARLLQKNKKTGVIMNISSAAGLFTYPSFTLYAASKRFVQEFSLSFDQELSPYGIRVLTALLGRFHSDFRYHASQCRFSSSPSWDTISLASAAKYVLQQINRKKAIQIIDWRYQVLCALATLIPRRWLARQMKKGVDPLL
jgi:uncharacterized protein